MTIINMPMDYTQAEHIDLSKEGEDGIFWKQIIPMDKEIVYKGQKMKFGADILRQIKSSFDTKVLDQTAFQLANDDNQHDTAGQTGNFDPKRYSGDLEKVIINNRGLFGRFKLTKEGTELINKNPKLGVSASLKPGYVDSDGNSHPMVLRHVLGTLDPKIKGMSPWSKDEISLSVSDEDNEEVIDLAAADTDTPDTSGDEKLEVDKSAYEKMQADLAEYQRGEALLDEILAEPDDNKVSLSNDEPKRDPALTEALTRMAKSEWKSTRTELLHDGVPASMLNLAESVMESPDDFTINLSNGEDVDPKETILAMLKEAKGTIDLSESGHSMSADEKEKEKSQRDDYVDNFMNDLF